MSTSLVVQYAVIALLVAASLWTALRKLAPKTSTRWQAAAAAVLLRPQRGAFAQRMGRFVQPKGATGNCGDGCDTCGTCGPADATLSAGAASREQPVTFHPRRK
ncbi:hypothetical protein LMG28688_04698 [Paraburkholderia caffeinitolerans]|uniref:Transmembrane protein n=1 Tax=Paraburkholderia caffeinitolerans TaxID=1723730 RepID=A0A6J5GDI8_9BURK|nr:DUF6587 family protein [Paraburkholderia caffeinitolerans]CAB3798310.1 hypothetical protein LMG28688_04698 [Paraburkholderia caffeinitolerans]